VYFASLVSVIIPVFSYSIPVEFSIIPVLSFIIPTVALMILAIYFIVKKYWEKMISTAKIQFDI